MGKGSRWFSFRWGGELAGWKTGVTPRAGPPVRLFPGQFEDEEENADEEELISHGSFRHPRHRKNAMDNNGHAATLRRTIMKSNSSTTGLTVALAISLILSVIFCLQFMFRTRELRALSGQIAQINGYRTGIQQLAADCLQYSEKNPAINPVLEAVGLKGGKTAAKPAGK